MRIVICPDKFRGTASASGAAQALAAGLLGPNQELVPVPLADGGEGTLDALGGANRVSLVTGPLGDPVEAEWRLSSGAAIIEMAQASGLLAAGGSAGNDPLSATTSGTGELIAEARASGARRIVVGVGGSASTDGGLGALRAMEPLVRFSGIELIVACDVQTKFLDAPTPFGPHKGATPAQIELLRRRLTRLAELYLEEFGVEVRDLAGAGAAGGLGGGLAAIGAQLVNGFDLVAEELRLANIISKADLVITGEGRLDPASFNGKVVGGVASIADQHQIPVIAVVGSAHPATEIPEILKIYSLTEIFGQDRAFGDTQGCLTQIGRQILT